MLNKIFIKIGSLIVIIIGLNFIYSYTLYENDLAEKCEQIIEIQNSQASTDIFYFGESSNFNVRENDSIKKYISEITGLFFPSLKLTTINKAATHAGIYKYWIKQIDVNDHKPKAVIVTLNMRSFDAAWINSKLETQLQESIVLVQSYPNLINRFLLSLQAFDNKIEQQRESAMLKDWSTTQLKFPYTFKYKTVREWDNAMGQGSFLREDGSWDSEKITLACHYIKGYAFNISENNPRIKDFDEIANWCNKNEINLYLNLMAENIEYADSLVGKELVFLMKQNRDFLVKRYSKNNCTVVDNLEKVDGLEFTDQTWTTEHYGYKGRMIIAKNLADSLRKQFSKQYKKAY
ncbi:MAG: hypothetical protein Q7W45_06580 [Bacteroidota bacterium]|nr:hypothetical protein [Bacteroidota bacterium]MDP3145114.1 hypothetical protein [Bacteroidota bacterium]